MIWTLLQATRIVLRQHSRCFRQRPRCFCQLIRMCQSTARTTRTIHRLPTDRTTQTMIPPLFLYPSPLETLSLTRLSMTRTAPTMHLPLRRIDETPRSNRLLSMARIVETCYCSTPLDLGVVVCPLRRRPLFRRPLLDLQPLLDLERFTFCITLVKNNPNLRRQRRQKIILHRVYFETWMHGVSSLSTQIMRQKSSSSFWNWESFVVWWNPETKVWTNSLGAFLGTTAFLIIG